MPINERTNSTSRSSFDPTDETINNVVNSQSSKLISNTSEAFDENENGSSGYSHTGAFADKPTSNNFVWQSGAGINYAQTDVNNEIYKVLSLSRNVHDAVDNPYWSTPTPSGKTGIGLFQGANLPKGVSTLFDYDFDFDSAYPSSTGTGFEGSTGRIDLS